MFVTSVIHHLVEGEGKVGAKNSLGDMAPSLRSAISVATYDFCEKSMEFLGNLRSNTKSFDVDHSNGVQSFVVHWGFCSL